MKYFGIAALVGLAAFWLFEKSAHAGAQRVLTASWYGERERGKVTASGDIFDPDKLTAASWEFYRKKIRVTGPKGSVVVFCNDRGPAKRLLRSRQLDLSKAAFERIADLKQGLVKVTIEIL